MTRYRRHFGLLLLTLLATACNEGPPLTPERYAGSDRLFQQIEANVVANPDWRKIADIDHSRLGAQR